MLHPSPSPPDAHDSPAPRIPRTASPRLNKLQTPGKRTYKTRARVASAKRVPREPSHVCLPVYRVLLIYRVG
jgi:hypothetical protein